MSASLHFRPHYVKEPFDTAKVTCTCDIGLRGKTWVLGAVAPRSYLPAIN